MTRNTRLAGIAAGTVIGVLWLLVPLVVITSATLCLFLKKLKKRREKNSFNLTHNPAYTEENTDNPTQFNSFNVTTNVNAAYNINPTRYLQALEQDVWPHYFQHGHRELQPLPIRSIALNIDQNLSYAPPGLDALPVPIEEPQDPDMEEDNHYETIV